MIALTAFDVNDRTLTLCYKIANRSDRDVWVCDGIGITGKWTGTSSEVYTDPDARTLVIAKRLEAPLQLKYVRPPDIEGRYVRLRPGRERIQTVSLGVPVKRYTLFTSSGPRVDCATRFLLRIGFYEEDLSKGLDIEEVVIPYQWLLAPVPGDEHYLEITIDGVFIDVPSR